MKLIVCLDDNNGMAFNNRRQSQDKKLRERLLNRVNNAALWMNCYSSKQFVESSENIKVCEDFLCSVPDDEYIFAENIDVSKFFNKVTEVIIYKWNRSYPFDLKFPISFIEGWTKVDAYEFVGNSHDKITEEVYIR